MRERDLHAGLVASCITGGAEFVHGILNSSRNAISYGGESDSTFVRGDAGIRVWAPELFFRYSAAAKTQYWNPIAQIAEIVRRIGPSLEPIPDGGCMTFTPHPELPGFPTHTFDRVHEEHYSHKNHTGQSSREAELQLQLCTVPGDVAKHPR
ncbi:MAG: hypothetical protein JWR22_2631 [Herminiimonas sp.]|nr:hypothetical protein [Herminiimonas sp.]